MKKLIIILIFLASAILISCNKQTSTASTTPSNPDSKGDQSAAISGQSQEAAGEFAAIPGSLEQSIIYEDIELPEFTFPETWVFLGEATILKGTIKQISTGDGGFDLILTPSNEADIPKAEVSFFLPDQIEASTKLSELAAGDYIQIYFDSSTPITFEDPIKGFSVNYWGKADEVIKVGQIESVVMDASDKSETTGKVVIKNEDGEVSELFFDSANYTLFYKLWGKLLPTDKVIALTMKGQDGQLHIIELNTYIEPTV